MFDVRNIGLLRIRMSWGWKMCTWRRTLVTRETINVSLTTEFDRNILRFYRTAVSGTVSVGDLSLSALLERLKASQLPWRAGLYSIGLSLWRRISKTTILSLWLSVYFVDTSNIHWNDNVPSRNTVLLWVRNWVCRKKKTCKKSAFI